MHIQKLIGALAFMATLVAFANNAQAKQHNFLGPHPIPPKHGGEYCYIEFPHVHVYTPYKAKLLYRHHSDGYYFVGDPVAHGFDGARYAYHGAHPIHVDQVVVSVHTEEPVVEWCYLKGPHYHAHPPPAGVDFEIKGDVHWYVGFYPPEFEVARPSAVRINTVYTPIRYERPTVVVEPPAAYVDVFVPAPSVHFQAGVGGVAHGHVGGGAHVEVHAPPPPVVGFSASAHVGPGHAHKHRKVRRHKGHGPFRRAKRGGPMKRRRGEGRFRRSRKGRGPSNRGRSGPLRRRR